ncbi:DNA-directed RNA polymerase sigma-70 factor [Novosphingobium sediminis]|uniref:DNA-directed RNA polymerase sigma-70 factor n=1 Tax=Novosphingobium sediminis TaxID=707214 RepID=A0A512APH4_9SPHN|nr:sigma-70 family RNA polymerase sigma factor [Novosphingobium sediminis]GEO01497.1 DNA-directed RNA polymerase sigma-70 factor [Novosphingobium sediminis]
MASQLETVRHAATGSRRGTGYDWEAAMDASLAGDAAAYRRLLEEAGRWLRRYFARRLSPEMVDDAVQEALTALHLKRATFEPGRPFLPWLAAIARFKGVDCLRSAGRNRTEELDEGLHGVASHESASLSGIVMARLFDRLRRPQADAIRLVKLQGFSVREAAAMTGQSEALIKVNIHRGLSALKTFFGEGDLAVD